MLYHTPPMKVKKRAFGPHSPQNTFLHLFNQLHLPIRIPKKLTAMSHTASGVVLLLLLIGLSGSASAGRDLPGDILRLPSEASRFFGRGSGVADDNDDDSSGTKWAVLIAGSNGYWNYRHQVLLSLLL
jgi:hypothetical protein